MQNLNVSPSPSSQPDADSLPAPTKRLKFSFLLLIVGIAMVLLALLARTEAMNAAPQQQGTVPPGGTLPTPPAVILLSLGSSGSLESATDELDYRDEDIISYVPSTGELDIYFDGSTYGLRALDLRDFEVLVEGGFIFTGNKPITIDNPNGSPDSLDVDDSDIVRYHPITDGFSIYLRGAEIGLTTDGEDVDALAFAPDGRLLLSTIGSATVNGASGDVEARDEDLIACDLTATPKSCTLYFDGSDVALTRGSEDLMSAWVEPTGGQPHFFSTKGRFNAEGSVNEVDDDREVIFGCFPLSSEEVTGLTDCDFFSFLDTEEELDREKQIDGMWLGTTTILTQAFVRSAVLDADYSLAQEAALDSEEMADALADQDAELDVYDFADVVQELYLPVVRR